MAELFSRIIAILVTFQTISGFHSGYYPPHKPDYFPIHPSHMARIKSIDVQCQKGRLSVKIEFDQPFNGLIYSKGYYSDHSCRYVGPNEGQKSYEFVIFTDRCGTTFVDEYNHGGQAYLENTIVIQNEPGIQEVWDTARRIRCLWQGQFDKTVTSSINVDMLDIISVTYSGDTVDSYMDIQLGKGPFAPSVTGLVKIGDTLTMVIYVVGSEDFDMHVKDCIAHDGDLKNAVQLTDARGCVLKKKLMGPWQKTKQTGNTGASVISYAFFQAFRFPDKMEVFLECNLEICKYQCPGYCPDYSVEPRSYNNTTRRKRSDSTVTEPIKLLRGFRVVTPEDISGSKDRNGTLTLASGMRQVAEGDVCLSTPSFVAALIITVVVLLAACLMTGILCVRMKNTSPSVCFPSALQTFSQLELSKPARKH
ncbi:cuticlin-1-like [Centruroides sculpturatus]|uniref:cuticlin-1-like n=1 Tax=Centruroides sculpturatus TaxID=218467 RepID=UPI000C6CF940|nr:cuticlin-1-like [Centruroides sculpturatus]